MLLFDFFFFSWWLWTMVVVCVRRDSDSDDHVMTLKKGKKCIFVYYYSSFFLEFFISFFLSPSLLSLFGIFYVVLLALVSIFILFFSQIVAWFCADEELLFGWRFSARKNRTTLFLSLAAGIFLVYLAHGILQVHRVNSYFFSFFHPRSLLFLSSSSSSKSAFFCFLKRNIYSTSMVMIFLNFWPSAIWHFLLLSHSVSLSCWDTASRIGRKPSNHALVASLVS